MPPLQPSALTLLRVRFGAVDDVPGSGDCEARVADWGQPALLVSSFAYVIVGLLLLGWGLRRSDVSRPLLSLFAAGLVLTGLGSADYHGPVLGPEPLLHDGGLALALLIALAIDLVALGMGVRPVAAGVVGLGVVGLIAMLIVPGASPALAAVLAPGLVLVEVLIYRRGLRRFSWEFFTMIGVLAVGAVVFALSRTGGPLCDPSSLLQGHAGWHLATAVALGLWGVTALIPTRSPMAETQPRVDVRIGP